MNILLIEKNENIIEKNVKTIDIDKLYSICGYRSNKDFQKLNEWEFDKNIYELYGKTCGKSDKENKYKFPIKENQENHKNKESDKIDKIDKINKIEKYYGNLCIIKKNGSITTDEWNIFYMSFISKLNETNKQSGQDMLGLDDENDQNDEPNLIYNKYIDDELTYEEYEEE